jgi:hypothetical protein
MDIKIISSDDLQRCPIRSLSPSHYNDDGTCRCSSPQPDIDQIIAYENGELDEDEWLELFAGLIRSGLVWSLQGSYGRTAAALIQGGYISAAGEVTA